MSCGTKLNFLLNKVQRRATVSHFIPGSHDELVSDGIKESISELVIQSRLASEGVSTAHKDLHGPISKLGKCIDKVRFYYV